MVFLELFGEVGVGLAGEEAAGDEFFLGNLGENEVGDLERGFFFRGRELEVDEHETLETAAKNINFGDVLADFDAVAVLFDALFA